MIEELYVIDDFTDGSIRLVKDLKDIKHTNYIVHSRITGVNLKAELWGTTANELLHIKR